MAKATLSAKLNRDITTIKRPFMAFAEGFGKLAVSRAELAPKFMKVFGEYLKQAGGSFVEFVRLIDPEIPAERSAYRAHPSFAAADYLRRLVSRRDVTGNRAKPVRSNLNMTARLLATIEPWARDKEAFWKLIGPELALTARQIGKLRQVVAASQPIIRMPNIRPTTLHIVHVPTETEVTTRTKRHKVAA